MVQKEYSWSRWPVLGHGQVFCKGQATYDIVHIGDINATFYMGQEKGGEVIYNCEFLLYLGIINLATPIIIHNLR